MTFEIDNSPHIKSVHYIRDIEELQLMLDSLVELKACKYKWVMDEEYHLTSAMLEIESAIDHLDDAMRLNKPLLEELKAND